jgi:hypothetical protein
MTVYLTEQQIKKLAESQREVIEEFNVSTDELKECLLQINFEQMPKMSVEEIANAIKKLTIK